MIMLRRLLFLVMVFTFTGIAEAVTQTRVLFVGKEPDHPFGTHMYMHTGNMLAKCLALTHGKTNAGLKSWIFLRPTYTVSRLKI